MSIKKTARNNGTSFAPTGSLAREEGCFAWKLSSPLVGYVAFFLLVPIMWGIYISMTNKTIGGDASFVGFTNFANLLKDKIYVKSIRNTVEYTIFAICGKIFFGTILALILNVDFKGNNICRALLLIPWSLPNIAVALNWRWIFSDVGGILNYILESLGIIQKNILWLGKANTAMAAIIVADVWRGVPFFGISILAKLQTLPDDYYEAAEIDGANILQKFFKITLPWIADVIGLTTLVSTIWTINQFDTVRIMTAGGPSSATELMNLYSYRTAMSNLQLGKGVAISVMAIPIFIILIYFATKKSLEND